MRSIKISIILNLLIVISTIFAGYVMFTGIKFMKGPTLALQESSISMFKYFTVDSNFLMGSTSFLFLVFEIRLIKGLINELPKWLYLLKLISTVGVSLTFFIVFTYLGPMTEYGLKVMLMNSNLFFHLIIPVLSIITFIFFERIDKLSIKDSLIGISGMIIYSLFYTLNVLIHMKNGIVSPKYDWYLFIQNGIWTIVIVVPIMFLITYLISFTLWKLNKKKTSD